MNREEAIAQLDGLLWEFSDRNKRGPVLPCPARDYLDAIKIALVALREMGEFVADPACPKCGSSNLRRILGFENGLLLCECNICHWAFGVEARYKVAK